MSLESAEAFYDRLANDRELAERVRALETPERMESYVKGELGYDFTRGEMQQVVFERNPEMTDEELEAVTGGVGIIELIIVIYALAVAAA